LIDVLLGWAVVFNARADFNGLREVLNANCDLIESSGDISRIGSYNRHMASCAYNSGEFQTAYRHLRQALEQSERAGDEYNMGLVCSLMSYVAWELGRLEEAISLSERAVALADKMPTERHLYVQSRLQLTKAYNTAGEWEKILENAAILREYATLNSEQEALAGSYYCKGVVQLLGGDASAAIGNFEKGIGIAAEPFNVEQLKLWLSFALLFADRLPEAEKTARETRQFAKRAGFSALQLYAETNLAVVLAAKGENEESLSLLEKGLAESRQRGRAIGVLQCEFYLGKVHALRKNDPEALGLAERYLKSAVQGGRAIGADGFTGMPLLELGILYRREGRGQESRECLEEALVFLEKCGAKAARQEAEEILQKLA
jgi:tetratricopeptide (TPR) repeat protein